MVNVAYRGSDEGGGGTGRVLVTTSGRHAVDNGQQSPAHDHDCRRHADLRQSQSVDNGQQSPAHDHDCRLHADLRQSQSVDKVKGQHTAYGTVTVCGQG